MKDRSVFLPFAELSRSESHALTSLAVRWDLAAMPVEMTAAILSFLIFLWPMT